MKDKLFVGDYTPESRAEDYFAGYGFKELIATVIAFVGGFIIAVVMYNSTQQVLYGGILGFGIVAIVILVVKRDKYDESLIDKLKIIMDYKKSQKQYEYEYYNIYENKGI